MLNQNLLTMKKGSFILVLLVIGCLLNLNFQSLKSIPPQTNPDLRPNNNPIPPMNCWFNYTPGVNLMIICESEFFCDVYLVNSVSFKDECYGWS